MTQQEQYEDTIDELKNELEEALSHGPTLEDFQKVFDTAKEKAVMKIGPEGAHRSSREGMYRHYCQLMNSFDIMELRAYKAEQIVSDTPKHLACGMLIAPGHRIYGTSEAIGIIKEIKLKQVPEDFQAKNINPDDQPEDIDPDAVRADLVEAVMDKLPDEETFIDKGDVTFNPDAHEEGSY